MGIGKIKSIKSIIDFDFHKTNNKKANLDNNTTTIATGPINIEEVSLDGIGNESDVGNDEIVFTNCEKATISKDKDGNYNISVITDYDNKNYELFDQGRGIGLSDYCFSTPRITNLKEKIPDSELAEIKDKIIEDCINGGLSPERIILLKELLNDDMFLAGINSFTVGSGCGTYSLLEVLRGYYNLEISDIDFYTSFLIKNLHEEDESINEGFDAWLNIVFGEININSGVIDKDKYNEFYNNIDNLTEKYSNESDELKNSLSEYLSSELGILKNQKTYGPLTVSAMSKILNNLDLNNERILNYSKAKLEEDGESKKKLKQQLQAGKPVIVMVENSDKINFEEFSKKYGKIVDDENGDYAKSIAEDERPYYALTNAHHFITLLCMDDNDNIVIADSRYLPEDEKNQKKYSHILEMNYDNLMKFIENPADSSTTSNTYCGKEQAGMLFVDP